VHHRVLTDLGDQVNYPPSSSHLDDKKETRWALLMTVSKIRELRDLCVTPSSPTLSSDEDTASTTSTAAYSETHTPFIFGYHSLVHSLHSYHPSPANSQLLLNAFEDNVAPIITIIHKPALRGLIQKAGTGPEELDRGSEALAFSVYFAAISSMTPEQCLARLGESHATLVKKYRFAVEQALARAGFLQTHKLVVLQAAVLFLTCASHPKDAQFVWTMIAVVVRLGLGLGLHRDGSHFGLSPFETEMRRRLWWYIYLLDGQSSEYQATSPQIREGDYDTRLPLNLDDDWSSDLVEPPQEKVGFTDMTLTLVRCQILISNRKLMQMTASGVDGHKELFKNRNLVIEESRQLLDERYLQFCDVNIPIHWVTASIARLALARFWLVSHFSLLTAEGFDASLWPDRGEVLVLTAIEVLEFVYLLETHPNTAKWSWLFRGYVQWQVFAFVLSELCARPTSSFSDRAWMAVHRAYERWNGPVCHTEGLIMRPLQRLMNRAAAIRGHQLRPPGSAIPFESNIPDSAMANSSQNFGQYPVGSPIVEIESLDIFRDVLTDVGLYQCEGNPLPYPSMPCDGV
jgi:hypothetical protein